MYVIFWVSAVALLYAYIGYPLLLALAGVLFGRRVTKEPVTPQVTFVIPVYNEGLTIERKIENTLASDYPVDKLRILIVSDGSTDATNEILRRCKDPRVSVIILPERHGKVPALKQAMQEVQSGIVVFSDAEELCEPDAVRSLAADFADPSVGCVCGELRWQNARGTSVGQGIGIYWRYELALKRLESRLGLCLGGVGQIYAIRRELFTPINNESLIEDFEIPMGVLAMGYRIIYDESARAYGESSRDLATEFGKKVRTLGGHYQSFFSHGIWRLLSPLRPVVAWELISHKILQRMAQPFLLVALLVASVSLARTAGGFYTWVLCAQGAFYLAAGVGYMIQRRRRGRNPLAAPLYFVTLNIACVAGLYRYLTRRLTPLYCRALPALEVDAYRSATQ
jgi:biofilm PGA synthesis N-glycosyltransferase PgaC